MQHPGGGAAAQHDPWAGSAVGAPAFRSGHADALHGPGGFADQLLAAQLHALHLGASAYSAMPLSTAGMHGAMGNGGIHQAGGHLGQEPSHRSVDHSSMHQIDPALLVSHGLLSGLQLGAGMLPHSSSLSSPVIPIAPQPQQHHAAQHELHHYAQHEQPQEQQRQQGQGKRRGGGNGGGGVNRRNEDKVRRTVYISDISDAVTEAQLAGFFRDCGQLVDCRVCGDPNSAMRFAFIEFMQEQGAQQALSKSGALLGDFPIRVSPSKTAIVPVNNTYLPRSIEERELVARTVFVGNIDRVVEREQLSEFFQNLCGPVSKIRVLGDSQHNAKIAFIEFVSAEGAKGALKLSGALLGTLPLRVSPSKTPVRADMRRPQENRNLALSAPPAPNTPGSPPTQLNPALLMAVAGMQMYSTNFQ